MTIATGKLTDAGLEVLTDKVEKLNKRAVRLGLSEIVVTVKLVTTEDRKSRTGLIETVRTNHIEVDGCAPCIEGWTIAARIEFTDNGNLVHRAPGIDNLDTKYRTVGTDCDHCNTKRRRNDVIVIRNYDGREQVVGRNCLADFLRTGDAESFIEYASWLGGIDSIIGECDSLGGERSGKPMDRVTTVVQAASICVRKLGWVSGRVGYDENRSSTKNDVIDLLYPPADSQGRKAWENWIDNNDLTVTAYDTDLAGKAIEWAKTVDTSKSDYLHNLSLLVQSEWVGVDKYGYLVSIIIAYNNACERETERKEREDKLAAKGDKVYIGEPKVRAKGIKATCVGLNSFEGQYGVTTLVRFESRVDSGSYAPIAWFASGDKTEDFEVGTEYSFDAMIKGHNDHDKYGKQTMVNRLKVLAG